MNCSTAVSPVDGRLCRHGCATAKRFSDTLPVATLRNRSGKPMKNIIVAFLTMALLLPAASAQSNKKTDPAAANPTDKLNPQIQKIVREISAANIEATIKKLVGF